MKYLKKLKSPLSLINVSVDKFLVNPNIKPICKNKK